MLRVISALLLFSFLLGCSSLDKKGDTPEAAFQIAEEFEKDDRFEEAIRRYKEVKNKFPYSSFAAKAELKIADIHFKNEEFSEAQIAYQSFRDLHPKHPQSDYVAYRIGLSYYNQLPDTIDRDLTLATDTIAAFNDLLKKYPQSEFVKDGNSYKEKTLTMLAEKELYVADFYYRQKQFDAALGRYEGVMKKYSGLGADPRALLGASRSARRAGHNEKANQYARTLKAKFPDSSEAQTREIENQ